MTKLLIVLFTCLCGTLLSQNSYLEKGVESFQNEEFEIALKSFNKASKKDNSLELKFWIASCYFKLEDFKIAKAKFLKIIEITKFKPESAMSMVNLGNCFRELKDIDSAIFYYDMAIDLYPKMVAGYFNKAQFFRSLSRFDEAKELYDIAIELDPSNSYYYHKRLEICFVLGNYDQALIDLLKVKELNSDADIDFNLAYCYSMLERFNEADSVFNTLYEENNSNAIFLNNYGFNKFKLGEIAKGKELINKSLSISSDNSYTHRNLAVIFISEGEVEKSCEHLKQAKTLNFAGSYGDEVDRLILEYCTE